MLAPRKPVRSFKKIVKETAMYLKCYIKKKKNNHLTQETGIEDWKHTKKQKDIEKISNLADKNATWSVITIYLNRLSTPIRRQN